VIILLPFYLLFYTVVALFYLLYYTLVAGAYIAVAVWFIFIGALSLLMSIVTGVFKWTRTHNARSTSASTGRPNDEPAPARSHIR
jgi:hypothetical protein